MRDYFRPRAGLSLEPAGWGSGSGVCGARPRLATCSARAGRGDLRQRLTPAILAEATRREISCWAMAVGTVCFCCLWLRRTTLPSLYMFVSKQNVPRKTQLSLQICPHRQRWRTKMDSLEETSQQPSALPSYLPDHTEHKDGHVRRPGCWMLLPSCWQVEDHRDLQWVYSKQRNHGR
ncbi:hypothetical protein NN561_011469 [Cricetulus griseus]